MLFEVRKAQHAHRIGHTVAVGGDFAREALASLVIVGNDDEIQLREVLGELWPPIARAPGSGRHKIELLSGVLIFFTFDIKHQRAGFGFPYARLLIEHTP